MSNQEGNAPTEEVVLQNAIDKIAGATDEATLEDGRKVKVSRIKLRHSAFFIGFVRRVMEQVGYRRGGKIEANLSDPLTLMTIVEKLPEEVSEALHLLTGMPKAEVGDLDIGDVLTLGTKAFEVNRSFFMEKIVPQIKVLFAENQKLFQAASQQTT